MLQFIYTYYKVVVVFVKPGTLRPHLLEIDPVQIVGMRVCVCPCLRLLITSGVMWHDMDLIRLVKQVLQLLYGNRSCYH